MSSVKRITPQNEITNCSPSLFQKIPTTDAMMMPMRPMKRNWPSPDRLRLVVVP